MRYHFFLHYGWFFQNLGKEAVRTFRHTTVVLGIYNFVVGYQMNQMHNFLYALEDIWTAIKLHHYPSCIGKYYSVHCARC